MSEDQVNSPVVNDEARRYGLWENFAALGLIVFGIIGFWVTVLLLAAELRPNMPSWISPNWVGLASLCPALLVLVWGSFGFWIVRLILFHRRRTNIQDA